jgi:hypothetical protein
MAEKFDLIKATLNHWFSKVENGWNNDHYVQLLMTYENWVIATTLMLFRIPP